MIDNRYGKVLGVVLAGGKGSRLMPLTKYRAKPAVQFGANYRIIDFALSNLINSEIFSIYVLVQFKSQSLSEHFDRGWKFGDALMEKNFFVRLVPAQMWHGERWFQGTADAVYQNFHLVTLFEADRVCIFAADHIYKMDVRQMLKYHMKKRAEVTISAKKIPSSQASQFGCIETDQTGRIIGFLEKPQIPPEIPGEPGFSYISMGNYIFEKNTLEKALYLDSQEIESSHDFGKDIIPQLVKDQRSVYAYDFSTNVLPGMDQTKNRRDRPYWRDVGTIGNYWKTYMDLLENNSDMTFFNPKWPIRTATFTDPPSYACSKDGHNCEINSSMTAGGCRIIGAHIRKTVMSRNCTVEEGSDLEETILGEGVNIGKNCKIKRAIIDSYNDIPDGTVIGYDMEKDKILYSVDEDSGIVTVPISDLKSTLP